MEKIKTIRELKAYLTNKQIEFCEKYSKTPNGLLMNYEHFIMLRNDNLRAEDSMYISLLIKGFYGSKILVVSQPDEINGMNPVFIYSDELKF